MIQPASHSESTVFPIFTTPNLGLNHSSHPFLLVSASSPRSLNTFSPAQTLKHPTREPMSIEVNCDGPPHLNSIDRTIVLLGWFRDDKH